MTDTKEKNQVEIPDFVTVRELADLMESSPIDVIKQLMANGIMAGINQQIDYETAAIVAAEMGFETVQVAIEEEVDEEADLLPPWRSFYADDDPSQLVVRPPVITILGHVDHGKTSLLDRIREANVQAGEAGGITQHIGAYQIEHEGRLITFLDTPGHAAFTAMRARGAQGADIAILVVAADDGVMPQTREAIAHARAAQVPIVVALNKIDRNNANPEVAKQQLAEQELVSDEWGGDTLIVPVSATTGEGLEDLLEAILLVADDTEILANPNGKTAGTILEAELDRGRGVMATLLVQNGTLNKGDVVLAGESYGRIKAMFDEAGNEVKQALPSTPVRVMGLNDVPEPGTTVEIVKSEKVARSIIDERTVQPERILVESAPLTLEDLYERFQEGEAKSLNLVVKVDVQGSVEPILDGLKEISLTEEAGDLTVDVLHSDVGNVSESDVMLASASNAIILGFQVSTDNAGQRRADSEHVEIRHYDIIYKLFEDVELALTGLLDPVYEDKVIGTAEVRQVFKIPKQGRIAGSFVVDGEARRDAMGRVVRDRKILHTGKISSLRRFQEDVREVRTGFECGIKVHGFDDYQPNDLIQFTVRERVQ